MAVQNDGRLLYGNRTVTRLNLDGSVDATFDPNFANSTIHAIAVQSDGSILVGGSIASVNGRDQPNIVRLLATALPRAGFMISGRVTDGTNGIAGVRLRTSRRNSTFTDETGAYTLTVSNRVSMWCGHFLIGRALLRRTVAHECATMWCCRTSSRDDADEDLDDLLCVERVLVNPSSVVADFLARV